MTFTGIHSTQFSAVIYWTSRFLLPCGFHSRALWQSSSWSLDYSYKPVYTKVRIWRSNWIFWFWTWSGYYLLHHQLTLWIPSSRNDRKNQGSSREQQLNASIFKIAANQALKRSVLVNGFNNSMYKFWSIHNFPFFRSFHLPN